MKKITQNYFSAFALLFLCATTSVLGQWQQLGDEILGNEIYDGNGRSVALSEDGQTVAIGANGNDANGDLAGMARVYRYDGTSWQQLGADFLGEDANDGLGYSIALSADGNTVAIGIPKEDINFSIYGASKIYQYDGSSWNQMGNTIYGENLNESAGWSLDLSSSGMRIAVGSPYSDSAIQNVGSVTIYEFNGSDWIPLGNKIEGLIGNLFLGYSVGLNTLGDRVVIGTRDFNPTLMAGGYVEVYDFDGTSWNKLGSTFNSEADLDGFGERVDISGDGNRFIIGAGYHDTGGTDAGRAYVYDYNGSDWALAGLPIDGHSAGINFGASVAISRQGNRIIIGAPIDFANGPVSGSATVYQFDGSNWNQLSTPLDGVAKSDYIGQSVAMNNDGSVFAYGGPVSGAGNGSGVVRVFDDSILAVNDNLAEVVISVYPNPTSGLVQFKTSNNITTVAFIFYMLK